MVNLEICCCRKCLNDKKNEIHEYGDYFSSLLDYKLPEDDIKFYRGVCSPKKNKNGNCICCGEPLEKMNINYHELFIIANVGSSDPDYLLAMNDLKKRDIITYTSKFNELQEKWNAKLRANDEADRVKRETEEEEKNTVRCPKCGSTQITTGQRGYSLFSGFLGSNKTVNRCAKCGYKWEPRG